MRARDDRRSSSTEAGFTLVETLIAVIVMTFGLMAVTNLFLLAATSNFAAGRSTGAAALASEQLDALKTAPFTSLALGGDLDNNVDTAPACPGGPANHSCIANVPGVGDVEVRWLVENPAADTLFITLRAVPGAVGSLGAGRATVELTTIRTCTMPASVAGVVSGCAISAAP